MISGALVLIAALVLVLGIIWSITLVYAAIGLSIAAIVCLLLGIFQRPPAGAAAGRAREVDGDRFGRQSSASKHAEPAVDPAAADVSADPPLEQPNAAYEVRSGTTGADVLVISGRPRYHLGGCAYVEGHSVGERLEINEARELGFTPCGGCRPNETLARRIADRLRNPEGPQS